MSFNVNNFRAEGLKHDGARPSQFEILVNFPNLIGDGPAVGSRLRMLAHSASLPPSDLGYIEVPYFGRTIKVEGTLSFPAWRIQVYNDEDFQIKAAFEAWINGMNAHVSNRKNPAFAGMGYKAAATVYQLSKELEGNGIENAIRAYTFSGLFPTSIGEIRLDWSDNRAIEVFDVVFEYDYWVPGADENQIASNNKYNGIDGSATAWNPKLPTDNQ